MANIVKGVSEGFSKTLEIVGVGYRAERRAGGLLLRLGSPTPSPTRRRRGISFEVPNQTTIVVKGPDKQQVGHVAAVIRSFRPPEPYKGKGVRYKGEQIMAEGRQDGGQVAT